LSKKGASVYCAGVGALSERLKRNESEFRLSQKPSKRDIEKVSEAIPLDNAEKYVEFKRDFFHEKNYLKINNTNLPADEAARMIVERSGFTGPCLCARCNGMACD